MGMTTPARPAPRRVLVTGATGAIGRHVLPRLVRQGWDVHATFTRQPPCADAVTWHQTDLLSRSDTARVVSTVGATHLLHLAWYLAPGRWVSAPENFEWLEESLALIRAFHAAGGRRVVTAGTGLEYDWRYGYCSEDRTPCTPTTAYGVAKHALQLASSAFAAGSGLESVWARIFFLYGPHEHPNRLVASVTRALLAGEPALCSHGNQIRDFLFVDDVADALVTLVEGAVIGPVNVGSGRPIALREIVTRIGQIIGRPELIRLGAIPQAATDTPLVVADTTRLSSEVGWTPACTLDEGLERTIDWWRHRMGAETEARAWT
jgi:nucleoside-diphosphate-sugar epimerase